MPFMVCVRNNEFTSVDMATAATVVVVVIVVVVSVYQLIVFNSSVSFSYLFSCTYKHVFVTIDGFDYYSKVK